MIIAIILVFLTLLLELSVNFKKRVVWVFLLYFISLCTLFYTSVLYIGTFSTYPFFTEMDYYLFQAVSSFPMRMSNLVRLHNIGTAMLMLSSAFMTMMILSKRSWRVCTAFFVPIAVFLIANSPEMRYRVFLYSNSPQSPFCHLAEAYTNYSGVFSFTLFLIYMIIPIFSLFFYQRRLRIRRTLETTVITTLSLITIDTFISMYFIFGAFSVFMPWNVDMLSFPKSIFVFNYRSLILPTMLFLCILIFCIITIFKPFGISTIFTRKKMLRMQTDLSHYLRMVFHSEKNTLLAVERLALQAADFYDKNPALSKGNIEDIALLAHDSMNSLAHTLDMLTEISVVKKTSVLVMECVRSALKIANIPSSIALNLDCTDETLCVNAAAAQISEAIANILKNSVEAIEQKDADNGMINLEIFEENALVSIQITDNGCGIGRKDISHIFSVLFSTKRSAKNWGVGLSYVRNVAQMYGGDVYVKSKVGEYTMFQFVLPLAPRKEGIKNG